jgi:thiamine kinase-like enzyme
MNERNTQIASLSCWKGNVTAELLTGGLSNESYVVTCAGEKFVVRFGRDFPFHQVSRDREVMTARAAHQAGISPEVYHTEPGVMVSRFVEGITLGEADAREYSTAISALLRDFHTLMPHLVSGPGYIFWVFHVIRDYARALSRNGSRMASRLRGYVDLADRLETVQMPLPIVYGHHDLLPANFIHDGKRLWLIDFEYAGFGTAMFDLAGIASNAGFSAEASEKLLADYFDTKPSWDMMRSHAAMQCASLLREAMWSMISEIFLANSGADYEGYTALNLERLEESLDRYQSRFGKLEVK